MTGNVLGGGRRAGVLLHPTSLPGPWDGGVLGDDALRFLDYLAAAGFSLWQTLPVGPVGDSLSPYQMTSACAGNPRLIDPEGLRLAGWLPAGEAGEPADWAFRAGLLRTAFQCFQAAGSPADRTAFSGYWRTQQHWLLPYALFRVAREHYGDQGWWTWPEPVRRRSPAVMLQLIEAHRSRIQEVAFEQWVFDRQWHALRLHAQARGIQILGDLPIYVDLDSVDVWWHRPLFRVDPDGHPDAVAGVPPDYFSDDGQLWGNPLYDWPRHAADGFRWWVHRVKAQLSRFDFLRIDHFRGLQACWAIPAGAGSAREGCWEPVPGQDLLAALVAACGGQPFVAEDLGTITPDVTALRQSFGLPGMLILQFAFDGSMDNPYLPANHGREAVVYTGTHDNDTTAGWYASMDPATRTHVHAALGSDAALMPAALIRAALESPAEIAVVPMQDLLGLGSAARMNIPGTVDGNWTWRFSWSEVPADFAARWRGDLAAAGRLAAQAPSLRYTA